MVGRVQISGGERITDIAFVFQETDLPATTRERVRHRVQRCRSRPQGFQDLRLPGSQARGQIR
ncbi:protein of unknown function [Streptomyces sp. KY75]|nr:protein of unknown function [Streptomyces sp. KY75]